jgi:hypothetical protein
MFGRKRIWPCLDIMYKSGFNSATPTRWQYKLTQASEETFSELKTENKAYRRLESEA